MSKIINQIKPQSILSNVTKAIKQSTVSIEMTMDLSGENTSPKSQSYFDLLNIKSSQIKITRLCFGSDDAFNQFKSTHHLDYENILCKGFYLRMILIDNSTLFFSKDVNGEKYFFKTTFSPLVNIYTDYFNYFLKENKPL